MTAAVHEQQGGSRRAVAASAPPVLAPGSWATAAATRSFVAFAVSSAVCADFRTSRCAFISNRGRRARRRRPHLGPEQQLVADGPARPARPASAPSPAVGSTSIRSVASGGRLIDLDAVLGHLGEAAQDRLQGAGVEVVAANDDHIVGPAQDAAVQPHHVRPQGHGRGSTRTRSPVR